MDKGIESAYVTDRLAIQFKAVRRLIMSEDFWDTLKLATVVLTPALVALRYCDGIKGGTVALLYNLLLKLDEYYSMPIKELDEAMRKKMHNVFMSRWSAFRFFEGSWGQGFQQDEGSVRHVCGCCGLQAGVCQYLHDISFTHNSVKLN
jgi:hypothetical protein